MQYSEKQTRSIEQNQSSKPMKIDSPDSEHEKHASNVAENSVLNGVIHPSGESVEGLIPPGPNPQHGMVTPPWVQEKIEATKGGGDKLPDSIERMAKSKSGDLDDVRIHTDSNAAELSKAVNAKAFTVGKDIYFGQGKFDTYTSEGKKLIAHEMAHAKDNKGWGQNEIQRTPIDSYYGTWDTEWYEEQNKDSSGQTCDPYGVDTLCRYFEFL